MNEAERGRIPIFVRGLNPRPLGKKKISKIGIKLKKMSSKSKVRTAKNCSEGESLTPRPRCTLWH